MLRRAIKLDKQLAMASRNVIEVKADDGSPIKIQLTMMDKIKRFLFSKQEWEAYLLEKIDKVKAQYNASKEPNDHPGETSQLQ